jgi:hypothetical protein
MEHRNLKYKVHVTLHTQAFIIIIIIIIII